MRYCDHRLRGATEVGAYTTGINLYAAVSRSECFHVPRLHKEWVLIACAPLDAAAFENRLEHLRPPSTLQFIILFKLEFPGVRIDGARNEPC